MATPVQILNKILHIIHTKDGEKLFDVPLCSNDLKNLTYITEDALIDVRFSPEAAKRIVEDFKKDQTDVFGYELKQVKFRKDENQPERLG